MKRSLLPARRWCIFVLLALACHARPQAPAEITSVAASQALARDDAPGEETVLERVQAELVERGAMEPLVERGPASVADAASLEGIAKRDELSDVPVEDLLDAYQKRLELAERRMIYEPDDRQEVLSAQGEENDNANATVALINEWQLSEQGDELVLHARSFGDELGLCEGESFREQPKASFCSGVLIGPDRVATAGHCVRESELANIRFVFDYRLEPGETTLRFPKRAVFEGKRIVARKNVNKGPDWAIVELAEKATGRHYVKAASGDARKKDAVYVIGHPSGLPAKIARGSTVRDTSSRNFFVANLDTYGGNSGSPVFSEASHLLVGLVARGGVDFVHLSDEQCTVSKRCPTDGCRGQRVTKLSLFRDAGWGTPP